MALIFMFVIGSSLSFWGGLISSLILTGLIIFGVVTTFVVSRLLSATILKGEASFFALELPPYRTPQIGTVIVRSLFDRTIFVLIRAIIVAAPAGLIIWILANITIGDYTLIQNVATFLNPFASLLGMDGVIFLAFILSFPANEILIPIMLMIYMSTNMILEPGNLAELKDILILNEWTWVTAISTILFCLFHWPCSTTCLTIKKETGSIKWSILGMILPTLVGVIVCFIFASTTKLLGLQ